ncbi:MAG: hypothetical protein ACI4PR_03630 [Acutalibacteraceae bacterium]
MNHKKFFWPSMMSLAVLGFIIATVAYFSSSHIFTDLFKTVEYKIETRSMVDSDKATGMWPGQTLDSELFVANTGECPVLVRIRYLAATGDSEEALKENLDNQVGENEIKDVKGIDLSEGVKSEGSYVTAKYTFECFGDSLEDPLYEYNSAEGCYYYKGILQPENEIQHMDTVTLSYAFKNGNSNEDLYTESSGEASFDENYELITDGNATGEYTGLYASTSENGASKPIMVRAYVETIQATDENGNYLNTTDVQNAEVSTLKGYWTALGK